MKIVIVGGGSAGWITAAFFVKHKTEYDITIIESSKIGIIGAGEGSTGTLPWFVKGSLQGTAFNWPSSLVNEMDFLRKTKATLKLGIRLKNWKGDGTSYYSPFHGSPSDSRPIDSVLLASILKHGRSDMSSLHSWMLEDGLSTFSKVNGKVISAYDNHSYHFDGVEVGKYFKNVCLKKGVKVIDSEVIDTTFDEKEYLKSVKLDNGQTLEADLFFDCSGFSKVLMSKTKNKWISYKEYLPVNSAIPFSTEINSRTVRFETLSEAMNSGWIWKIPLQQRHGCGYVYCDGFQTYEQSVDEVEKKLGYVIEPVKHIKFEPGRFEKTWYNNIVAIGLSSHFLEPLQATSIHVSLISISNLVFHYLKDKNSIEFEQDKNRYNDGIKIMIEDYMNFIQMHYLLGRNDTPFWKFITNELKVTDRNKEYFEIAKYRLPNMFDTASSHGTPGWPLWSHIMHAAGLFKKEFIIDELKRYGETESSKDDFAKMMAHYNRTKNDLIPASDFFKYLKA
jgi:tryptophan halogenase